MLNFENYTKIQNVNGGEQWKKRYEDGEAALVMVYGRVTREKVACAFRKQEDGGESR